MVCSRSLGMAALAVLFLAVPVVATGQAYTYTDGHGQVHFTDNYYEIPEAYRNQIETRDMPAVHDPASGASDENAPMFAAFQGFENLSEEEAQALAGEMGWALVPFFVAIAAASLLSLAIVIHGIATGRYGWAIANFFVGITVPFYIMSQMEQAVPIRLGLLAVWLSPFVTGILFAMQVIRAGAAA